MPGIVGLMTMQPRERAEPELFRMVEALRHEPFYTTGTWVDEAQGLYVGWIARKDSFSDGMPLRNERGDVLIFSGEEFPDPTTAQRLRELGHRLDPEGPAYLVHLCEEDPGFLAGLNGRFHGLLAERSLGTVTLFNDRYGMHRVYYHESRDAFYFAAEAKAILAVRPELRSIDPKGLGEFVSCGSVMDDRTLFAGIHLLPGAAAWLFRRGALERKAWYFHRGEWEDQPPLESGPFYQQLREVFARNLSRYFKTRQRVGMSLTGGLDTRMIMAWQRPSPGSLPCYTFGGVFRESQDVVVARAVARVCEQPHEIIPVGQEFLARFPSYAERSIFLTDGCLEVHHSADLYLNERAREIAPIRMTGNYGGEVLRRVVAFGPARMLPGLFAPELSRYIQEAARTFASHVQGHPLSFAVFRQAPWHHHGLLALEESQLSLRSPYLDNDLVQTVFRAPRSALASDDISQRLIGERNFDLWQLRTDSGPGGGHGSLVAGFSGGLRDFQRRAEYAYDYGMPQWLARVDHLLSPLRLERLFLGRHKFCHFRVWYRDVLACYVQEVLLDPGALSRSYLDRNRLEMVVKNHLKGHANFTTEIHKLLSLELLHRLFIDRPV